MATHPQSVHTFEEYLELERKADFKSEYHGGAIYAMSGGTEPHSRLSIQTAFVLFQHFRGCRIYDSNLKLYIRQADRCVYPDTMMLCGGEPVFHEGQQDIIVNPSLVVEVLSPSTRRYDQGTKTEYYRSVPSIEHILLVAQDVVFVDHFARQTNGTWIITSYNDRSDLIPILGNQLPVAEIYSGILQEQ